MKKDVFNPDEWDAAGVEKERKAPSPAAAAMAQDSTLLALVKAVEATGTDLTADYSDWLAIAFALVSELGEGGRELFHRLSRFYPRYDAAEADRQYSACVRDGLPRSTASRRRTAYGGLQVTFPMPRFPHENDVRKLRKMRK